MNQLLSLLFSFAAFLPQMTYAQLSPNQETEASNFKVDRVIQYQSPSKDKSLPDGDGATDTFLSAEARKAQESPISESQLSGSSTESETALKQTEGTTQDTARNTQEANLRASGQSIENGTGQEASALANSTTNASANPDLEVNTAFNFMSAASYRENRQKDSGPDIKEY